MTAYAKSGTFQIDSTKTAGQTQAVTGLGFQPKLIIFYWNGLTSATDTVVGQTAIPGVGFSDGTDDYAIAGRSVDGGTSSSEERILRNDSSIVLLAASSTIDGRASISSYDSDGFTLSIDDQFSANFAIGFFALGGTDLSNVKVGTFTSSSTTGNQGVTGVGFQPSTLMLIGLVATSYNTFGGAVRLPIGFADNNTDDAAVTMEARDGRPTTAVGAYGISGEIYPVISVANLNKRGTLVSYDTDGFTINWVENSAAVAIPYLAFKGLQSKVVEFLSQTDTTTTVSPSVGFAPLGALVLSVSMAESTADTFTSFKGLSIGSFSSTTSRNAFGYANKDASADAVVAVGVEYDEFYIRINDTDTLEGNMDVTAIGTTDFTAKMDDADPDQAWITALVIGGAGIITKSLSGEITPAGALIKQTNKPLAGAITPVGDLIKQIRRSLSGAITPSGILSSSKVILKSLAGAITPSGALIKRTNKTLSGAITPAGALIKQIRRSLAGAITPSGILSSSKVILKSLAGAITPSGALIKRTGKALSGAITPTGALIKQIRRSLSGAISPAGALIKRTGKALSGAITPAGALIKRTGKALSGAITPAGALIKQINKSIGGTISFVGALVGEISLILTGWIRLNLPERPFRLGLASRLRRLRLKKRNRRIE